MKITKIELKDFHQFKDVTLDLTYPAGHEKAGQPLDKVCFIGQSGTGKTTLLELIPMYLRLYSTNIITKGGGSKILHDKGKFSTVFGHDNQYSFDLYFTSQKNMHLDFDSYFDSSKKEKVDRRISNTCLNKSDYPWQEMIKKFEGWKNETATKIIYFPSNLNYDINTEAISDSIDKKIVDFSKDDVSIVWNLILETIQSYQEQELQIRQEISKTVEQSSNDLDTIRKALQKLEEWKANEFNPIQDVANKCLNPLLRHFKLKVKTELDIKTKDDIGFIKIEDYNGNEIPHGLWSTGTKQVVLSALPLYLLKPKHTVILFDEPERSLYPDLQRIIIDFYSSLTENCQFFYSTHSPIIASSFEPWEIVELKFNEEGHIYRELYYEGENYIDNYKYNPRYMRWDDILQRIFDMKDDGSPERKKKLDELATYNVKYKKLDKKNNLDSEEAKDLLEKIASLSKDLS